MHASGNTVALFGAATAANRISGVSMLFAKQGPCLAMETDYLRVHSISRVAALIRHIPTTTKDQIKSYIKH